MWRREFVAAMRPLQPPRGRDAGPGWYSYPRLGHHAERGHPAPSPELQKGDGWRRHQQQIDCWYARSTPPQLQRGGGEGQCSLEMNDAIMLDEPSRAFRLCSKGETAGSCTGSGLVADMSRATLRHSSRGAWPWDSVRLARDRLSRWTRSSRALRQSSRRATAGTAQQRGREAVGSSPEDRAAAVGRGLWRRGFVAAMRPWQPPRGRDAGPGCSPWRPDPLHDVQHATV